MQIWGVGEHARHLDDEWRGQDRRDQNRPALGILIARVWRGAGLHADVEPTAAHGLDDRIAVGLRRVDADYRPFQSQVDGGFQDAGCVDQRLFETRRARATRHALYRQVESFGF